jgi:hypothetical protein
MEFEVEFLPLVHPNEGDASEIGVEYVADAAGERVRGRLAEEVAHVRTRDYLQCSSTHPALNNDNHLHLFINEQIKYGA